MQALSNRLNISINKILLTMPCLLQRVGNLVELAGQGIVGRIFILEDRMAKPNWVFELWCLGLSDQYAVKYAPISRLRQLFYRVRGRLLMTLFGWWRWANG
jgi:hypothetical protein